MQSLAPESLAAELGIPEQLCESFLTTVARRAPEAEVQFGQSGDRPWIRVDLEFGYALDIAVEEDCIAVGGHGGSPGSQIFYYLIPPTPGGQVNRRCDKFTSVVPIDDQLHTKMYEGVSALFGEMRRDMRLAGKVEEGGTKRPLRPKRRYRYSQLMRA